MARKHKKIRLSDIRRIAQLQPTKREAAAFLGVSPRTFAKILKHDERAARVWEDGFQHGMVSLRRKQFRLASTNAAMAIFLGKQYLGQSDVQVHQHATGENPLDALDLTKLSGHERETLRDIITRANKGSDDNDSSGT